MFEFSRGPLIWIAFAVFLGGSAYRLISIISLARKEKVILPFMSWKFGLRSIMHWILPFGAHNMRIRPGFTLLTYFFHGCLLLIPLLTLGHVLLWQESWGIRWWALPDTVSKIMTFIVILGGIAFLFRRIANPTVRFVTTAGDIILIVLVLAPFVTGLMAYYQLFAYKTTVMIHMWTGALWLIMIPFTRIAHMLYFPLTRAYMGSESGYVRNSKDW